jgi:hypothetical protein
VNISSGLLGAILLCLISYFVIRDGWLMIRDGKEILFFPAKIGFFITKVFLGTKEAERRRKQYVSPEKNRLHGKYALIGGSMIFTMGIFLFVDALMTH